MVKTDVNGMRSITTAAVLALMASCQSRPAPALSAKGPLIQSAVTCADFTQILYFEAGGARITPEAERLIAAAAARARGCDVTGVDIVGLADAPGGPAANLALSRRRGDAVRAALHRQGFDKVEIQVAAAGATGAETGAGQSRPVRRRADVAFHLKTPNH